jgi:hypothetical protein
MEHYDNDDFVDLYKDIEEGGLEHSSIYDQPYLETSQKKNNTKMESAEPNQPKLAPKGPSSSQTPAAYIPPVVDDHQGRFASQTGPFSQQNMFLNKQQDLQNDG